MTTLPLLQECSARCARLGVDAHFLCFQNVGLLLRAFHGVHWRAATSVKRHLRFRAGITLPKVTAEIRMLLQWIQAPPLHTRPPSGVPLTLTLSQVILPRVALATPNPEPWPDEAPATP